MDDVDAMTESHESRALNQNADEDKNVGQGHKRSKLTRIVASDSFDIFLKVWTSKKCTYWKEPQIF